MPAVIIPVPEPKKTNGHHNPTARDIAEFKRQVNGYIIFYSGYAYTVDDAQANFDFATPFIMGERPEDVASRILTLIQNNSIM